MTTQVLIGHGNNGYPSKIKVTVIDPVTREPSPHYEPRIIETGKFDMSSCIHSGASLLLEEVNE